jgi:hypothetical protein
MTKVIAGITTSVDGYISGGTHLFDGFSKTIELEHLGVRQSPFATFVDYRVKS